MGTLNYTAQESSNLSAGQGGMDVLTMNTVVKASDSGVKRWIAFMIVDGGGGNDIDATTLSLIHI